MFVQTDEFQMNRFLLPFFFLFTFSFGVSAQKYSYVYFESETRDPFYILINGKINFSSSLNGLLTIPQLLSGTYDAEVGFVRNKYPAQHFIITIDKQDFGFVIKKIKEGTFGLMNLQTFSVMSAINTDGDSSKTETNKIENTPQGQILQLRIFF